LPYRERQAHLEQQARADLERVAKMDEGNGRGIWGWVGRDDLRWLGDENPYRR
jgi:hypothetical protein